MNPIETDLIKQFVNNNIDEFHNSKIKSLERLKLTTLLKKKNPYLFRAKNITTPQEFVQGILDAHISSSEEEMFGRFLEDLAIFIASHTCDGRKSSTTGIDLEFENDGIHYLVSIKSGVNWGNSSQHKRQEENFRIAARVLKQSSQRLNVQPVLGICYGKASSEHSDKGYLKVVGQAFWLLISQNENLFVDLVEPIGYRAAEHNAAFTEKKEEVVSTFSNQFEQLFCDSGEINWEKLVRYNSG